MNRSTILSTPGPVTGASKRAGLVWTVLALGTYLATVYAVTTWNTLGSALLIVLFGHFVAMIPAALQAYQNGSVVLSFLITLAPVFGTITEANGRVEGIVVFVVAALFAGATAHLVGFESSHPRPASETETRAVAGIIVLSGGVFIWVFRDLFF